MVFCGNARLWLELSSAILTVCELGGSAYMALGERLERALYCCACDLYSRVLNATVEATAPRALSSIVLLRPAVCHRAGWERLRHASCCLTRSSISGVHMTSGPLSGFMWTPPTRLGVIIYHFFDHVCIAITWSFMKTCDELRVVLCIPAGFSVVFHLTGTPS